MQKYQKNCSNCPQLNFLNLFDLSKQIVNKKKLILEKYNLKFSLKIILQKIYENSYSCKNLNIRSVFLGGK